MNSNKHILFLIEFCFIFILLNKFKVADIELRSDVTQDITVTILNMK